jgi:hypothetical protein
VVAGYTASPRTARATLAGDGEVIGGIQ